MSSEKTKICSCGQSKNICIDYIGKKVTVNLELSHNKCNYYGILYGKVTNDFGKTIKNAVVKIMSVRYDPLFHTKTDSKGNYFFDNIPINKCYKVFAIAKGYKLSEGIKFCIKKNTILKINLLLKKEINDKLAIIVGNIFNKVTVKPINKAVAILFENINGCEILKTVSYTNEFGQFAFTNLTIGNYIIKICAVGYMSKAYTVNITKCGQIVNILVPLCPDNSQLKGTVSGVITDEYEKPINEADVILYRVRSDNTLFPIDFTRTNKEGVYLFMNVSIGAYKIKANKKKWISINVTWEGVENE